MQLAYAMLADAAQVGADGKFTIMGGDFDTIFAPSFPTQHPNLAVVMRLNLSTAECGPEHEHRLRITLTGPLGQMTLPPINGSFTTTVPPDHKGGFVRAAFVVNMAGIVFETAGSYTFHIAVDGEPLGDLGLHVAPRV